MNIWTLLGRGLRRGSGLVDDMPAPPPGVSDDVLEQQMRRALGIVDDAPPPAAADDVLTGAMRSDPPPAAMPGMGVSDDVMAAAMRSNAQGQGFPPVGLGFSATSRARKAVAEAENRLTAFRESPSARTRDRLQSALQRVNEFQEQGRYTDIRDIQRTSQLRAALDTSDDPIVRDFGGRFSNLGASIRATPQQLEEQVKGLASQWRTAPDDATRLRIATELDELRSGYDYEFKQVGSVKQAASDLASNIGEWEVAQRAAARAGMQADELYQANRALPDYWTRTYGRPALAAGAVGGAGYGLYELTPGGDLASMGRPADDDLERMLTGVRRPAESPEDLAFSEEMLTGTARAATAEPTGDWFIDGIVNQPLKAEPAAAEPLNPMDDPRMMDFGREMEPGEMLPEDPASGGGLRFAPQGRPPSAERAETPPSPGGVPPEYFTQIALEAGLEPAVVAQAAKVDPRVTETLASFTALGATASMAGVATPELVARIAEATGQTERDVEAQLGTLGLTAAGGLTAMGASVLRNAVRTVPRLLGGFGAAVTPSMLGEGTIPEGVDPMSVEPGAPPELAVPPRPTTAPRPAPPQPQAGQPQLIDASFDGGFDVPTFPTGQFSGETDLPAPLSVYDTIDAIDPTGQRGLEAAVQDPGFMEALRSLSEGAATAQANAMMEQYGLEPDEAMQLAEATQVVGGGMAAGGLAARGVRPAGRMLWNNKGRAALLGGLGAVGLNIYDRWSGVQDEREGQDAAMATATGETQRPDETSVDEAISDVILQTPEAGTTRPRTRSVQAGAPSAAQRTGVAAEGAGLGGPAPSTIRTPDDVRGVAAAIRASVDPETSPAPREDEYRGPFKNFFGPMDEDERRNWSRALMMGGARMASTPGSFLDGLAAGVGQFGETLSTEEDAQYDRERQEMLDERDMMMDDASLRSRELRDQLLMEENARASEIHGERWMGAEADDTPAALREMQGQAAIFADNPTALIGAFPDLEDEINLNFTVIGDPNATEGERAVARAQIDELAAAAALRMARGGDLITPSRW